VNEDSNAVVVIGPPPICHMMMGLAEQLDRPNPLVHRPEPARRPMRPMVGGAMRPGMGVMRGQGRQWPGRMGSPHPDAPRERMRRPREPETLRQMRQPRPELRETPRGPLADLWILASPRTARELKLSDDQAETVRDVLNEGRERLEQMARRIRAAVEEAGPEEREELHRQLRQRHEAGAEEVARGVRERIMGLLEPEQRHRLEQWMLDRRESRRNVDRGRAERQ
jgi:hypothetical protein